MNLQFTGKTVLITGATSGIGSEIALTFARNGAAVMLTGRNRERGERMVRECTAVGGVADFQSGDLTHSSFANELVLRMKERFSRLDVLVNCAGSLHVGTAEETNDEAWRQVMSVNLDAAFYVSRAAVPVMRESGGGVIVNIAGDWGLKGAPRVVAYCASKGALIQLTKAMAIDHAREGIRVNAVCPGDVDTEMLDELSKLNDGSSADLRRERLEASRNGRLASTQDVANAVLFISSPESAHITGATLSVDGGSMAG